MFIFECIHYYMCVGCKNCTRWNCWFVCVFPWSAVSCTRYWLTDAVSTNTIHYSTI